MTTTTPPKTRTAQDGGTLTRNLLKTYTAKAGVGKVRKVYPSANYYDGFVDTSKNGLYAPDKVLSAHDGMLDFHVHSENGQPLVAALSPDVSKQGVGQLYGRWELRFRSDVVEGYKEALLLWPDNTPGTNDGGKWIHGEIDFVEGDLGGRVSAFSHRVDGRPDLNAASFSFNVFSKDWHTYAVEWLPNSLTIEVDGQKVTTTNPAAIPVHPMHAVLQIETRLDKEVIVNGKKTYVSDPPPLSAEGHAYIDYFARYGYTPKKVA